MTNPEAWKVYAKYLEGWKPVSKEQRIRIAAEVVAEDVEYCTSRHESGNRETAMDDMAAFQEKFPGGHFEVGDVSAHHDRFIDLGFGASKRGSVCPGTRSDSCLFGRDNSEPHHLCPFSLKAVIVIADIKPSRFACAPADVWAMVEA